MLERRRKIIYFSKVAQRNSIKKKKEKKHDENRREMKVIAFFCAFVMAVLTMPMDKINADTASIEYTAIYTLTKKQAYTKLCLPSEHSHTQELKITSKFTYLTGTGKRKSISMTAGPFETTGVSQFYNSPEGLSFICGYAKFYINGTRVKKIERSL